MARIRKIRRTKTTRARINKIRISPRVPARIKNNRRIRIRKMPRVPKDPTRIRKISIPPLPRSHRPRQRPNREIKGIRGNPPPPHHPLSVRAMETDHSNRRTRRISNNRIRGRGISTRPPNSSLNSPRAARGRSRRQHRHQARQKIRRGLPHPPLPIRKSSLKERRPMRPKPSNPRMGK